MQIISMADSDGDGFEYEVIVSDGEHSILCFADSKPSLKEKIGLYVPLMRDVKKSKNNEMSIVKAKEYFGYYITAEVVNIEKGIIKVFGFEFELGEKMPCGILKEDLVDVHCIRIDCQSI